MSTIFPIAPGTVVRVPSTQPSLPMMVDFGQGTTGNFVVTQAALDNEVNISFVHSLQNKIFAYSFGDKVADFTVGGLAFLASCGQGSRGLPVTPGAAADVLSDALGLGSSSFGVPGQSGFEQIFNFYRFNKASTRGGPVRVRYGLSSGFAYLVGSRIELARPELPVGVFSFRFKALP